MKYNNSNLCLIIVFFVFGVTLSQNQTEIITKSKAENYLEKANKAVNLDSILVYSNKVLAYSKNDSIAAHAYYNLAYVNFKQNKYAVATTNLKTCIPIFKKVNNQRYVYRSYSLQGTIAEVSNNYDLAISNYDKAQKYATTDEELYAIKHNLSIIYTKTNQFDIANAYIQDILKFNSSNPDVINSFIICYVYMGLTYTAPTYKEKMEASNKAVALAKTLKNEEVIAETLLNRGGLYVNEKKFSKALSDFTESNRMAKQINATNLVTRNYINIAELYNKTKAFKLSNSYMDSIDVYNSLSIDNDMVNKASLDTLYYSNYLNLKQYKKAIIHLKNYNTYLVSTKDSIINSKYVEYGKKYQTDKKIQENELLKKENRIKSLEVAQQKKARDYLIVFSVLGIIAFGSIYSRFSTKKKAANLLAKQYAVINQQKVDLEQSNSTKQKLFGIIAHDLINPFNAILGYTNLLEEDYNTFTDAQRKTFISTINKYANSNYNLTRTLLDWAKVQQDKFIVNKTQLKIKDVVDNALQPYQVLADKKQIKVIAKIPRDITIEADQNMMQTVIANLFVNAIKFTPQQGEINLHLDKNTDGTVTLEIKDNGIGMSQEQLNNLFDITKVSTSQGTNKESGNGLGLILCKELIELQKGTLQIFSKLNKGSRAVITI